MIFSIKSWRIVIFVKALIGPGDSLLTRFLNWGYDFAFTPTCWRISLIAGSLGMTLGATGYIYWLQHIQVVWLVLPSVWLFIFSALLLMLRWSWKSDTQYKEELKREIEARQQT